GASLPPSLPAPIAWLLCAAAAFAAGAALGAIAGVLKAFRGAHELVTTIMFNFIVGAAMVGAGKRLFERATVHTAPIVGAAALVPRQMIDVVEGVIIFSVVAATPEVRRLIQRSRPAPEPNR